MPVTQALNTRFDIYDNGNSTAMRHHAPNGSLCPPSINTRKDLVRRATGNGNKLRLSHNGTTGGCRQAVSCQRPWRPQSADATAGDSAIRLRWAIRATLPRLSINGATAHAAAKIGDGNWDRTPISV